MSIRLHGVLPAVVTALALVVPAGAGAQDVGRMEQLIQTHTSAPVSFMGAVLVARGDARLLDKGYGFANVEWRIDAGPSTRFRLGSVTKQFTAAAVLLLEEQGRLSVTDPIRTHLANLPDAWSAITIQHLLGHTAGLPNYTAFPDYVAASRSPVSTEELVSRFRDRPLEFAPGSEYRYSNSGYAVLGLLIEKVSGQTYADFVRTRILEPLGMKDSGYDAHATIIERRASGYAPGPAGLVNAPYLDMSVPHAAGGLYSTTGDLLTWQRALYGGRLVSKASLAKMVTPGAGGYGLGVAVSAGAGRRVYQHGGGINGFASMLAYYPETETSVVVLSNVAGPSAGSIAAALGAVAHGDSVQLPSERTAITLAPDALAAFVGTYEIQPGGVMYVRLEGASLTVQIVGQPRLPIFAESPTRFFLRVVDAQIDFVRDGAGAVTHLVLHQNGASREWKKTSATAPSIPAARTSVTVAPDVLARYVGVYELKPGFDLTIALGPGGGLTGQATGQGPFPLLAESPTRFFFEQASITIEFVSNAGGAVTHMIFEQGGGKVEAKRK
jgi:CubicO group peptidase (beta-lactamase class C family)